MPEGLCDRLRVAGSGEEIDRLLKEGEEYKYASDVTRRRWKYIAARRRKQMNGKEPVKEEKSA